MLSFFPFQEAMELRLETGIFFEGYCGLAAYTCLEMDTVLPRGCTGTHCSSVPDGAALGSATD